MDHRDLQTRHACFVSFHGVATKNVLHFETGSRKDAVTQRVAGALLSVAASLACTILSRESERSLVCRVRKGGTSQLLPPTCIKAYMIYSSTAPESTADGPSSTEVTTIGEFELQP